MTFRVDSNMTFRYIYPINTQNGADEMYSAATDGNAAAERNHHAQQCALGSERDQIREEFELVLAKALRTAPRITVLAGELLCDDYTAVDSFALLASIDAAEAGLHLSRVIEKIAEVEAEKMLDSASRSVIEQEISDAQQRNTDNLYLGAVSDIERFIKEIK